jgi:D-xylose 1-dehydrogenase (NADP+, D-xylono-1,5-lactone-forming)
VTSRPTRWGIISTARINELLLDGARQSSAVELFGVASRDAQRAAAYAADRGIPRAYGSYEALLDDPDIEAVYVSLPNSLHHEWTLRALGAGKHVLCEKPYSRRAADVEEAFALAERQGLCLSEAFMWRHNPQTARLLELLPEIGKLQTVRATFAFVLSDTANVRMRPELDGGSLMDLGCYCVSGARLVAGEPRRVYVEQVTGETGVDVRLTGLIRFADDVVAEFTCSFDSAHQGLELIGREGSLRLPDPWHVRQPLIVHDGEELSFPAVSSYRLELENVSAAIRGEAPLLLGRADALGQARTIEALYRSADLGAPVELG